MTLGKIKVSDFQSIHEGEVELGSFTVFTGPSSSGKSAFMRAAHAVARNSFVPAHVRQGAKETHVTMSFDGHTVEAIRGKSKSTYRLDGRDFTKAGRTVPPEIEEVFKLPLVAEVETTFSSQFEKPYLISEPGSTAAKVLGSLTNVSVIHEGLREVNRRSLGIRSTLKVRSSDLEDAETRLEEFEHLERDRPRLDEVHRKLGRVSEISPKLKELGNAQRRCLEIQDSLQGIGIIDVTDVVGRMSHLSDLTQKIHALYSRVENTRRIQRETPPEPTEELLSLPRQWESFKKATSEISKLSSIVESIPAVASELKELSIDREIPEDHLNSLTRLTLKIDELSRLLSNSERLVQMFQAAEEKLDESTRSLLDKEHEFATMLDEFHTCPLCGHNL